MCLFLPGMDQRKFPSRGNQEEETMLRIILALSLLCLLVSVAAQADITLTDPMGPNSSVVIDPLSSDGVKEWNVGGINQIAGNWFWYRIGGEDYTSSIDSIGTPTISQPISDTATITYAGDLFDLAVTYTLIGSDNNSSMSDLEQTVSITNNTASALDFHLFQLVDFDLAGTSGDDTAHRDPLSGNLYQNDGAHPGLQAQVGANGISHWEIAPASDPDSGLWDKYQYESFANLSDSTSPLTGDVAWGLQKDFSIAAHGSAFWSEDVQISSTPVPEPGTISSLGAGLVGLLTIVRRRR
jgi:hypothetical protein